jgi:hypothetical protein
MYMYIIIKLVQKYYVAHLHKVGISVFVHIGQYLGIICRPHDAIKLNVVCLLAGN